MWTHEIARKIEKNSELYATEVLCHSHLFFCRPNLQFAGEKNILDKKTSFFFKINISDHQQSKELGNLINQSEI